LHSNVTFCFSFGGLCTGALIQDLTIGLPSPKPPDSRPLENSESAHMHSIGGKSTDLVGGVVPLDLFFFFGGGLEPPQLHHRSNRPTVHRSCMLLMNANGDISNDLEWPRRSHFNLCKLFLNTRTPHSRAWHWLNYWGWLRCALFVPLQIIFTEPYQIRCSSLVKAYSPRLVSHYLEHPPRRRWSTHRI